MLIGSIGSRRIYSINCDCHIFIFICISAVLIIFILNNNNNNLFLPKYVWSRRRSPGLRQIHYFKKCRMMHKFTSSNTSVMVNYKIKVNPMKSANCRDISLNTYTLTRNRVHIISPRASFAVPTSIGPSVLPVGHVSSRTGSTPTLVLYSEDFEAVPQSNQRTFQNGVSSSSVKATDEDIFTISSWNGSTTGVSIAADGFDWKCKKITLKFCLEKKWVFNRDVECSSTVFPRIIARGQFFSTPKGCNC